MFNSCREELPARKVASDLDVNCPDGMTDDDYVALVFETLESVIASWHPDFVIYDAGSDVHVDDALGRLSITTAGLYRRDYGVISRIQRAGIPCATVIGGGYDKDRSRVAESHGISLAAAASVFSTAVHPFNFREGLVFLPVANAACFGMSSRPGFGSSSVSPFVRGLNPPLTGNRFNPHGTPLAGSSGRAQPQGGSQNYLFPPSKGPSVTGFSFRARLSVWRKYKKTAGRGSKDASSSASGNRSTWVFDRVSDCKSLSNAGLPLLGDWRFVLLVIVSLEVCKTLMACILVYWMLFLDKRVFCVICVRD